MELQSYNNTSVSSSYSSHLSNNTCGNAIGSKTIVIHLKMFELPESSYPFWMISRTSFREVFISYFKMGSVVFVSSHHLRTTERSVKTFQLYSKACSKLCCRLITILRIWSHQLIEIIRFEGIFYFLKRISSETCPRAPINNRNLWCTQRLKRIIKTSQKVQWLKFTRVVERMS